MYWPTGNPGPDFIGDDRQGDNLYTSSILALDARRERSSGTTSTRRMTSGIGTRCRRPLVDATWRGQPRKLLLHANRNGFFYVLDRITGKLLLGTPFVKKLTWATGLARTAVR